MDRTREFLLLAEATGVPQRKKAEKAYGSAEVVSEAEKIVENIEKKARKGGVVDRKEMAEAENILHTLYMYAEDVEGETEEIEKKISASVRKKYSKLSLRLSDALRAVQRANSQVAVEQEIGDAKRVHRKGSEIQQMYQDKEQKIVREEISTLRKREMEAIETHINELGQMLTEVSMHIAVQGEQLERVDELFAGSKTALKKGSFELNHALAAISGRRRTIILIFSVFFFLLLLRVLIM